MAYNGRWLPSYVLEEQQERQTRRTERRQLIAYDLDGGLAADAPSMLKTDRRNLEEEVRQQRRVQKFGAFAQPGRKDESGEQQVTSMDLDEKRRLRAERFGIDIRQAEQPAAKPMDTKQSAASVPAVDTVELPDTRRDASSAEQPLPDSVHVSGMSSLNTNDLYQYFMYYAPTAVEWVNEASCNVRFEDAETAGRVMKGLGKPFPSSTAGEGKRYPWYQGPSFAKAGMTIPLAFRQATLRDVAEGGRYGPRSMWPDATMRPEEGVEVAAMEDAPRPEGDARELLLQRKAGAAAELGKRERDQEEEEIAEEERVDSEVKVSTLPLHDLRRGIQKRKKRRETVIEAALAGGKAHGVSLRNGDLRFRLTSAFGSNFEDEDEEEDNADAEQEGGTETASDDEVDELEVEEGEFEG
eukprot:jgi/Chlat1/4702/Chrsp3S05646